MAECRKRCRALLVDDRGSIVEHQLHDSARLVADAEVFAVQVNDRSAQFPWRERLRRAPIAAGSERGHDRGDSCVDQRASHAVVISAGLMAWRPWKMTNSAGSTISVN